MRLRQKSEVELDTIDHVIDDIMNQIRSALSRGSDVECPEKVGIDTGTILQVQRTLRRLESGELRGGKGWGGRGISCCNGTREILSKKGIPKEFRGLYFEVQFPQLCNHYHFFMRQSAIVVVPRICGFTNVGFGVWTELSGEFNKVQTQLEFAWQLQWYESRGSSC
jgi:hypothetical protein